MSRGTPERTVQIALLRWLRLVLPPGSIVAAIKNEEAPHSQEGHARARFHAARKASGTLPGMPDLICLMPTGRTVFVEVKAPGGVVSEAQDELHAKARAIGHIVIVCDSIEACRWHLKQAGVPLREAAGQAAAPSKIRVAKAKAKLPSDMVPF